VLERKKKPQASRQSEKKLFFFFSLTLSYRAVGLAHKVAKEVARRDSLGHWGSFPVGGCCFVVVD